MLPLPVFLSGPGGVETTALRSSGGLKIGGGGKEGPPPSISLQASLLKLAQAPRSKVGERKREI